LVRVLILVATPEMVGGSMLAWLRAGLLGGRMGRDVLWNLMSVLALSVLGLGLNIIIGRVYGAATLGVFNQAFAAYILLSQFCVGGLHFSVLKHGSHALTRADVDGMMSSAVALVCCFSGLVAVASYFLRGALGAILRSPDVATAFGYAAFGLFFFSLNKVLFALLNASRHMRAYAAFQALRYVLMLAVLLGLVALRQPGTMTPLLLSGAELGLSLFLVPYSLFLFRPVSPRRWGTWLRVHLQFGGQAFFSGVLTEINTRVDVLLLGFFANDAMVGVYSIAALVAEGLYQIPVVLRTNLNPLLAQHYNGGNMEALRELVRRGVRTSYWVVGAFLALAAVAYPLLSGVFMGGGDFMASWPVFCILAAGMAAVGGYLPFMMLLVQAGKPGHHTLLMAGTALSNGVLNVALIPLLGIYGSALATSVAFVLGAVWLRMLSWRVLRFRM
jgi:O-antigen/teichoic acid export membrane protein